MARGTSKKTVARAKALRRSLSLPEAMLWARLKGSDVHFRKQHPVGPYIVDFYCASRKLAIEVDGEAHNFGDCPCPESAYRSLGCQFECGSCRDFAEEVVASERGKLLRVESRAA